MKAKLASENVSSVLHQAGTALRTLSKENEELKEKIASYEHRGRVEKIASIMQDKNLDSELSYDEKVEKLMSQHDLDAMERAIEMSAPQVKLASLSDRPGNAADAVTRFEEGILSE